jgi:HAAS
MITDYLAELIEMLELPAKRRRRIVAEVEDHLQCAATELHASGLDPVSAEREAVRRFGPARELAQAFLEDEAARAGRAAGGAAVALALLVLLVTADPPGLMHWPETPFPTGVVSFVSGQVALVAGALTLLRIWRAGSTRGPRGVRLALVLRGAQVVVVCALVVLGCALILAIPHAGSTPLREWLVVAVLAVGLARAWPALWRGRHRTLAARIDPAAAPDVHEDALSDVLAFADAVITRVERRVAVARGLRSAITSRLVWLRRRAPRLTSCFDLRHDPWRFASMLALLAGATLAFGHGLGEGGPPPLRDLARAFVAGAILLSVEGAAVLVSFGTLGRFLGIRATSAPGSNAGDPSR